jgi:hypothetical protein
MKHLSLLIHLFELLSVQNYCMNLILLTEIE